MLNKYPLWKYLLILAVLAIGFIYSAPNLYPNDPAIQISGESTALKITEADVKKAEDALKAAGIAVKAGSLGEKNALLRLTKMADQLPAKDVLRHAFGDGYVVALNLAYLVVGVVVVEVVFVYPGLGQLLVDSVSKRDIPVVQACSLIFAATYILLNTGADVLSIASNPRLMHPKG